jgi:hypothetical protein
MEKRFIVKKYVLAETAAEALAKESSISPEEVWVDDKYQPEKGQSNKIGF